MDSSINDFLQRVIVAQRRHSKDIRLSMDEAKKLSTSISKLLSQQQILPEQSKQEIDVTLVKVDGGAFKK